FACQASTPTPAKRPVPSASAQPQLSPQQQLERAAMAFDAGRFAEAETAYQLASKSADVALDARLGLRRVYLITGRHELAAAAPEQAIRDAQIAARTLDLQAQSLIAMGEYDAAKALLSTSTSAASRLRQGELLIMRGHRSEAEP